jgi:hypothetical protein
LYLQAFAGIQAADPAARSTICQKPQSGFLMGTMSDDIFLHIWIGEGTGKEGFKETASTGSGSPFFHMQRRKSLWLTSKYRSVFFYVIAFWVMSYNQIKYQNGLI